MKAGAVRRLLVPLGTAILALLLWNTFLVYPLKIFVVFLHEISHGLAAVLTGGRITAIGLTFDEGGVCVTEGASRFLILNAGYLGSLIWGALFLVLGTRRRLGRPLVAAVGGFTLVVTILFVRTPFGLAYGFLTGAALVFAASRLPAGVSSVLLSVIGAVSCLYAVWDVGSDVIARSVPGSDAHALALLTRVPALFWGALWIALSLAVVYLALRRVAGGSR